MKLKWPSISLTKRIVAILESRGPTPMQIQLRYSDKQIADDRLRLAKDLVRVGRLAKKSDAEILASVRRNSTIFAPDKKEAK